MNKINPTKLKGNGYIFISKNSKINNFVNLAKKIIFKYIKDKKINFNNLGNKKFEKLIFQIQNEINRKYPPKKFFKNNKKIFSTIFSCKEFALQHYFYLRAVKISSDENIKPISFHRETFQGPKYFKNIYNLWIPLLNCTNKNSIFYYPKSHKLKKNSDFKIKPYFTKIKKGSYSHKTGNLYKARKIIFKKKKSPYRLFKKNHLIIFSGELIHGNGINNSNKIRFSLDVRFMKRENMLFNPIQSANKKTYFTTIKY